MHHFVFASLGARGVLAIGAALFVVLTMGACSCTTHATQPREGNDNREIVRAAFDRWRAGTGGPFELLNDDVQWTIVGSSPHSKTYTSKKQFIDEVITPFNARMSSPLVPTVRGIYADGDTVIVLFDAESMVRDGKPYHNTYTWYLTMKHGRVAKSTAFFDTRLFDEMWARVMPVPRD